MRNQNIVITRGQIGAWASVVGGISLLVGLIGVIWQGGFTPLINTLLIIGGAGLFLWAAMTPQEFRDFLTGRQARYGTTSLFGTLLLVGIVTLVYIILQRQVITLDMTEGQRYTLSNQSKEILGRISRPIRITGFYSPQLLQQRELDDQFFRQYEIETNGMITREYINPDEQPALAERFNVPFDGAVYISYLNADGSVDFNTLARVPRSGSQERDITEAISRLLISGELTVYFNTSHGERDPLDGSQEGLSGINNGIRESGLITLPLSLSDLAQTGGNIPDDASALVLVRPLTDFSSADIAVIDRYLKRGGGLFIMADVLYNESAFLRQDSPFNQYLWENYGLRALDAVVVDTASSFETPLDIVSAAIFVNSTITQRMDQENTPARFRLARAIEVNENPPADTPNGRLVMSSPFPASFGETNLKGLGETNTYQFDEGQDIQGPLTMTAWANNQQTGAKILLVGDSDWATNGFVLSGGNSILFTDGLSWLTGLGERIFFGVQSYSSGLPVIGLTGQQLDVIAFMTQFLMPGIVLLAGILIWWRRSRA
jgi:ABC-type uncharacterized transport system involved in gliding motility auxiliary subunit